MDNSIKLMNLPSKFSISAPGKVILHGEHSVVYGHLAIAASLNLRTKLDFEQIDDLNQGQRFVHILMPNIGLDFSLSSSQINHLMSMTSGGSWDFNQPQFVDHVKLVESLHTFMKADPSFRDITMQQNLSMKCFLFLMIAILNQPNKTTNSILKPFRLSLSSELPVGAGAGSSASYCVSVATVFLCLASLKAELCFCLDERTKDLISSWAFLGERITHGNPSGLDNSICTFGSLIAFRRPNSIVRIPLHSCLRVLLVDTKVTRNTRVLVDQVAKLRERHENPVKTIMEAMDCISSEAIELFTLLGGARQSDTEDMTVQLFSKMEELWAMNHSLLVALGVSHPTLERIIQISREHNLSGKLTGAGGGGFAIVFVPVCSTISESTVTSLKEAFTSCGFDVKDVELGGPGVLLH